MVVTVTIQNNVLRRWTNPVRLGLGGRVGGENCCVVVVVAVIDNKHVQELPWQISRLRGNHAARPRLGKRLEETRKVSRHDILHKINNGLLGINKQQNLQQSDPRTRGPLRFLQERADQPTVRNSFFPRTIWEWNQLPQWHTRTPPPEAFMDSLGSDTDAQCHLSAV